VDNVEVEPIHVDHSIPGAYGFIVYTSEGTVVYTGDFRVHGAKPEMTVDFVEKAREADPVAAITEATNMIGASVSSEREVEEKLDNIVRQSDGIVLANFASTDIDRINSFHRIAKKNGKKLAVSLKQAYLLEALREDKRLSVPSLNDENLLIFRKSKKTRSKWEIEMMEKYHEKVKNAFEISKQQSNVILALSFYDLEELVKIQPKSGSCYVLSASEPFNEEMEIDFGKLVNWLNYYGLPQYHIHVSGHIMPLQLKKLLKEIDAAKIFPVHTENAELFAKFVNDLKSKVVVTEKGRKYTV